MKLLFSLAFAGLTIGAGPAVAADLFGSAPPLTFPATQGPTAVEVGSNWYVRGDLGITFDDAPTISLSSISTPPPGNALAPLPVFAGSNASSVDFTGGVGFGYRLNDYLRFDATWDYRGGPGTSRQTTVVCPYALSGETSQTTGLLLGYLYNTSNTCNGATNIHQYNNTFLANGYVDLGTYYGFTPYVGGGLGFNMNVMSGSLNYYRDGQWSGLCGGPDADRGLPTDMAQSLRRADHAAAQHRLRPAKLDPVDQGHDLHRGVGPVGGYRLSTQSEHDPRYRLSLPQQRRDHHAGQPANRHVRQAEQRVAATAARRSLRSSIGVKGGRCAPGAANSRAGDGAKSAQGARFGLSARDVTLARKDVENHVDGSVGRSKFPFTLPAIPCECRRRRRAPPTCPRRRSSRVP